MYILVNEQGWVLGKRKGELTNNKRQARRYKT